MRVISFGRVPTPLRLYRADGWLTRAEIATVEAACAADAAPRQYAATGTSFEADATTGPLALLERRINAATGIENAMGGTLRYRHYRPGEAHPAHFDHYEVDGLRLILTVMMWLRAPAAGGETRFPRAGLALAPQAGSLAAWENCLADGRPDPLSWHEGLPVLAGDKITLTSFVYAPRVLRPAFADAPPCAPDHPAIIRNVPA